MDHGEFVNMYRKGSIRVQVDKSAAMHVCDRDSRIGSGRKAAHSFWKNIGCLLPIAGIASLIWLPWYYCVGGIILALIVMPATQKSAAEFVLEAALENESFYASMLEAGIIRISKGQA